MSSTVRTLPILGGRVGRHPCCTVAEGAPRKHECPAPAATAELRSAGLVSACSSWDTEIAQFHTSGSRKRSSRTRAVFARRGVCAGAWQGGWVNMGENAGPRPPATAENPQPAGAAHSLRKFWRGKWRDQAQGDQNGRVGVGWRPSHDGAPWEEWCAYVSQRLTPGSPPEVA